MFRNYLKTAFRTLIKNKLYSGINIIGLTAGLSACLLIGVFITHELSYDEFNRNAGRIVRVTMEYGKGGSVNTTASTGTKVGPQFKRTFPGIEEFARCFVGHGIVQKGEKLFDEPRVLFADQPFFKIFSFHLLEGNAQLALDAPDKIVLTKSMAKKYFGDESAINKTITALGKDFTVSAVCDDVPQNSQIKFDFVTQFLNIGENVKKEKWWEANWVTYLLLRDKKYVPQLQQLISGYMNTAEIREEAGLEGRDYLKYHLEPLTRVHLYSNLAGFEPNGNISYIYIFTLIALLILVIASANYTNLATAQSTGRGNEIGMRKVLGASKKQIFFQFIAESAGITFISAAISLVLGILLIPYFNDITGKQFTPADLLHMGPIITLIAIAVFVSFLAGFYPAIILSGTKVMGVLKKGFRITGGNGGIRKALIVIQFGISVFLIIFTAIILQQMYFLHTKDLGYDKQHIVVLPISAKMRTNLPNLKDALAGVQGVQSVTAAYETPEFVEWGDGINVVDEKGKKEILLNAMPVDLDFTKTLKMELLAGRDFRQSDFAMLDTSNDYANFHQPYIINEVLAQKIGWTPEEAIGKTIEKGVSGPVVGVVKDFNFNSLREPIGPILIFLGRDLCRSFMVRIEGKQMQATLNRLEAMWKQRIPDRPFTYNFLDEDYNKLYVGEQRSSNLFTVAATLAIVLAFLGLFGMAAFSTVQRTKEIGIRRVLGANIGSITMLIAKSFLLMVAIAILLAVPLAWYTGNRWLQDFAFRIPVQSWVFFVVSLSTISIALATIAFHSVKAALANPVRSLRTE